MTSKTVSQLSDTQSYCNTILEHKVVVVIVWDMVKAIKPKQMCCVTAKHQNTLFNGYHKNSLYG